MNGITVDLRVHPRARRTALECAAGALKAAVTAPPEDGKANDAVIALLSAEWRLPKSAFAVIKGASARTKTVSVSGEPGGLATRVVEWVQAHG
jgi:uncharacterized protein YggU (UPF0235/DUF167 family)